MSGATFGFVCLIIGLVVGGLAPTLVSWALDWGDARQCRKRSPASLAASLYRIEAAGYRGRDAIEQLRRDVP